MHKKFMTYLVAALALMPSWAMAGEQSAADKVSTGGAPNAASQLTDFAIQKVNSLIDGVSKAMPQVTHYALEVTRMGCIVDVSQGCFCLLLSGILGFIGFKSFSKCKEYTISLWDLLCGFSGIGAVVTFIAGVIQVGQIWSWVCVAHPDLYLIHLAVQKITG